MEGEDMFSNRIISRNASVGYSSRIYYYRSSEGIPFNWEMQPGTPKEPRNEDADLPPISPPPAILSLALPKPCINIGEPKPSMKLMMFKFWKQGKRNLWRKRVQAVSKRKNEDAIDHRDKYYSSYETFSSDEGECIGSPQMSSSSSSSRFSFTNGRSFRSSSPARDSSSLNRHYGCSPLNFSSILVRVSRSRRL